MNSKQKARTVGIVFLLLGILLNGFAVGYIHPSGFAIVNTASLSVSPLSGQVPLSVSATLCKGTGSWTAPFSFVLGWGDGTQSSSSSSNNCMSFAHTYSTSGQQVAYGTISDNYGHSASASATVAVSAPSTTTTSSTQSTTSTMTTTQSTISTTSSTTTYSGFTVSIISGPSSSGSLTWTFIASTTLPAGASYNCQWSFGSGACTASYTFSSYGTYTISVTATANNGQSASTSQTITVGPATTTSTTSSTSSTSTTVTTANLAVACTLNGQAAYSTTTLQTTTSGIQASCTVSSGQSLVNSLQFVVIDSANNKQTFTMAQSGATYTYSYTLPAPGTYTIQANAIEASSTVNLFSVVVGPSNPVSSIKSQLIDASYFLVIIGAVLMGSTVTRKELGI